MPLICNELHPKTGDACTLQSFHVEDNDPRVRQHQADNGVKWPSLPELDPKEGYNPPMPYRI